MSTAAITKSDSTTSTPSGVNRGRLWRALLWKEVREIGYYAAIIMLLGFLLLLIGPSLFTVSDLLQEFFENKSAFATLARVFPILLIISCASASFSIEHENRSYHFLRALPLSAAQIFWIKCSVLALFTLACCLLFWPYAYSFLLDYEESQVTFRAQLPATFVSIGEAFLWALMFSLRGKSVIRSMILASVGFFVVTNGLALVSQINVNNRELDTFFYFATLLTRIGIALTLIALIRSSAIGWNRDAVAGGSKSSLSSTKVMNDRRGAFAPTRRLIWLQLKGNLVTLLTLAAVNAGLLWATANAGYGTLFSYGYGHLFWSLSIAFMAVVAYKSSGRNLGFLVSAGYRPRQIWLTHSLTLLGFCLLTALIFGWVSPFRDNQSLSDRKLDWFYIHTCLIGFAVGQFVAMFCRSMISAFFISSFFLVGVFYLYMFSLEAFENQLLPLVSLALLPLTIVGYYFQPLATRGRLGARFWLVVPSLFAVSLVPLTFQRIYEVPDADVQPILKTVVESDELDLAPLQETRKIGDWLLANRLRMSPTFRKACAEVVIPLTELEFNQKRLLENPDFELADMRRWKVIQFGIGQLWGHLKSGMETNSADHQQVDRTMKFALDWNQYLWNHQALYWWAHHPETNPDDVRALIQRLENENEVFDTYRVFAKANFQFAMASVSTQVNEYPEIHEGLWIVRQIIRFCPWEVARFQRNSRVHLQYEWEQIEAMQKHYASFSEVFEATDAYPKYKDDFIFSSLNWSYRRDSRSLKNAIFYRRIDRLYLALALWQREHAGQLPSQLADLEKGYLKQVPVSPITGEKFYLAPQGLSQQQFDVSEHTEYLVSEWNLMRRYSDNIYGTPVEQPFIWINDPGKDDRQRSVRPGVIRSVDDFVRVTKHSNLSVWIIPRRTQD